MYIMDFNQKPLAITITINKRQYLSSKIDLVKLIYILKDQSMNKMSIIKLNCPLILELYNEIMIDDL